MRILLTLITSMLLSLASTLPIQAQNWSQWLGPDSNGVSEGKNLPINWTREKNTLWETALPGPAASTPIVWNNRVVLTSPDRDSGKNLVLGFDLDGKELWRKEIGSLVRGKHKNASGCNPSPVTDGKLVYVYFKSGDTACLDFEGKIIWQKNLQKEYGKDTLWWDLGTSPVLHKSSLIYAVMQEGPSYVVALDKNSGKEQWKFDRTYDVPKENEQAYTTPFIYKEKRKDVLVIWGADHLTGHDLGNKGKELWSCANFNPDGKAFKRVISSAVHEGDMAVVAYDRATRITGVRLGGKGDITDSAHVWSMKTEGKGENGEKGAKSADVPTPCTKDGKAYILADSGTLTCIELKTGKVLWSNKLGAGSGKFTSSPTWVDGKVVCVRSTGQVYTVATGDTYKLLSESNLNGMMHARPVFFDGKVLFRTLDALVMIGSK